MNTRTKTETHLKSTISQVVELVDFDIFSFFKKNKKILIAPWIMPSLAKIFLNSSIFGKPQSYMFHLFTKS